MRRNVTRPLPASCLRLDPTKPGPHFCLSNLQATAELSAAYAKILAAVARHVFAH
jgi:hypothetical protein